MLHKGSRALRREARDQRIQELRNQRAKSSELTIIEFNPLHFRIRGRHIVDYWPSTGRAWKHKTRSSLMLTTAQACALAAGDPSANA
jgi:hypothetical protein